MSVKVKRKTSRLPTGSFTSPPLSEIYRSKGRPSRRLKKEKTTLRDSNHCNDEEETDILRTEWDHFAVLLSKLKLCWKLRHAAFSNTSRKLAEDWSCEAILRDIRRSIQMVNKCNTKQLQGNGHHLSSIADVEH